MWNLCFIHLYYLSSVTSLLKILTWISRLKYTGIYPVAYFKQLHEQLSSFKSKQIPLEEKTPKERMKNLKINV